MAGTGSGRINPAGSCLPDIRPDSRIRKFENAGYPGSGDPAKTPIRWNPNFLWSETHLIDSFGNISLSHVLIFSDKPEYYGH